MKLFPNPFLRFSPALRTLLPATLMMALAACSTPPIHGMITTHNNEAIAFRSGNQQLLLSTGPMDAHLGAKPEASSHIDLKSGRGEIRLHTKPEYFQLNHFYLPAKGNDMSADVKGVWREETTQVGTQHELQECLTWGMCMRSVPVEECHTSRDGKSRECRTRYYRSVYGHYPDCPGTRMVEVTRQQFLRTLSLEFIDPAAPQKALAHYEGKSPLQSRTLVQNVISACSPR